MAQGIGKRVFGVHCNGTDTAAILTASPSAITPSLRGVGSSFWIPLRYLLLRFPWDLHTTLTWLVLPFDGLDLLAAVFVFRNVECHAGDYGCMIVRGDQVAIERWNRGASFFRFELNRTWAQVVFRKPRAVESDRLVLWSHGNEVEFGIHLTRARRAA